MADWTEEYTEIRLQEAMDTLRAQSARGCFPAKHQSCMPAPLQNFWDVWNGLDFWEMKDREQELNRTLHRPAAKSISEMDEIIFALNECFLDRRNVVVLTARNTLKRNGLQTAWRDVGDAVGISHTWVKDSVYPKALEQFSAFMRKKTLQNAPENATKSAMM